MVTCLFVSIEILSIILFLSIYMYLPVYIAVIHLCFYFKIEIHITGEQEPGSPVVIPGSTADEHALGSPVVTGPSLANEAVVRQW